MPRKPRLLIVDAELPFGIVQRVAAQTIPTGAITTLQHDTLKVDGGVSFDFTNFWFTVPLDGMYTINGFYQCVANGVGFRGVLFYVNGALAFSNHRTHINTPTGNNGELTALEYLFAGDTVQMRVLQNSGGNLNTAVLGQMSQFSIIGHMNQS